MTIASAPGVASISAVSSAARRPSAPRHARAPASDVAAAAIRRASSASGIGRANRPSTPATSGRTFAQADACSAIGEMLVETGDARRRARPAKRAVERAHLVEPANPFFALAADQGMLEQRQQRHRRQIFRRRGRNPQKQGARRHFGQRQAGAVVRLDIPAPKQGRNPPREHPVGRDQRGGSSRRLQRFAQRQRDPQRFGRGIGKLGRLYARQPPLGRLQAAPFVAEIGARHGVGDRSSARGRRRRPSRRGPQLDLAARHSDPVEQQFQMILRVGLLDPPLLVGPERVPFRHREARLARLSAGKHDHAAGHSRDAAKQGRDRRRGGGDARRDGEAARAGRLPSVRRCGAASALRRSVRSIAPSSARRCGQRSMIARSRSSDTCQCAARSGASAAASCERARFDLLDQQRIEGPGKVLREPKRLGAAEAILAQHVGQRE